MIFGPTTLRNGVFSRGFAGATAAPGTFTRGTSGYIDIAGVQTLKGVDVPRFNSKGLLIEDVAENNALDSIEFDGWVATNVTVIPNVVNGLNGVLEADELSFDLEDITTGVSQVIVGLIAETEYTISVWVWTDVGTKNFRLGRSDGVAWADPSSVVSGTLVATVVPQRFIFTYTTGVGETTSTLVIGSEGKTPFEADAGIYYAWGFQHETGAFTTSFIYPTGATRDADWFYVEPTPEWPLFEGSVELTFEPNAPPLVTIRYLFSTIDGTDGIDIYIDTLDQLGVDVVSAANPTTTTSAPLVWTPGVKYNIQVSWALDNKLLVFRNGILVASSDVTEVPTAHDVAAWIGCSASGNQCYGYISKVEVKPHA